MTISSEHMIINATDENTKTRVTGGIFPTISSTIFGIPILRDDTLRTVFEGNESILYSIIRHLEHEIQHHLPKDEQNALWKIQQLI